MIPNKGKERRERVKSIEKLNNKQITQEKPSLKRGVNGARKKRICTWALLSLLFLIYATSHTPDEWMVRAFTFIGFLNIFIIIMNDLIKKIFVLIKSVEEGYKEINSSCSARPTYSCPFSSRCERLRWRGPKHKPVKGEVR